MSVVSPVVGKVVGPVVTGIMGGGGPEVLVVGDSYAYQLVSGVPTGDPYYAQYLNNTSKINNVGRGGAKLGSTGGGGAAIKDDIAQHLLDYPTASTVILNGGTNDIKGPDASPPDFEQLKADMAEIMEAILADDRQLVVLDMPPIADYADLDFEGLGYGALRLAGLTDYNAWLAAYAPSVGAKFVSIFDVLDDGAGGIHDDYDLDGLHANEEGCAAMAAAIDPQITSPDVVQTNTTTVMRNRPNPELLTVADITLVTAFVDSVTDEWSSAKDVWLFKQSDHSAGGNALTGLKGTAATVTAGSPSSNSNGIVMPASSHLDIPLVPNTDWSDNSIGAGIVVSESPNDTDDNYMYGTSETFGFSHTTYNRWQGTTALKSTSSGVGGENLTGLLRSNNLGNCIEARGVDQGGGDVEHSIWISGVQQNPDPPPGNTAAASRSQYNFAFHANRYDATTGLNLSAGQLTYSVFYLTDGSNTPATWATAAEAA